MFCLRTWNAGAEICTFFYQYSARNVYPFVIGRSYFSNPLPFSFKSEMSIRSVFTEC